MKTTKQTATKALRAKTVANILKILSAEGVTDHMIAETQRYLQREAADAAKNREEARRAQVDLGRAMKDASPYVKRVVAAFVRSKFRDGFEVGLRAGLALAVKGREDR